MRKYLFQSCRVWVEVFDKSCMKRWQKSCIRFSVFLLRLHIFQYLAKRENEIKSSTLEPVPRFAGCWGWDGSVRVGFVVCCCLGSNPDGM